MGISIFTPAPLPADDYLRSRAVDESGLLPSRHDPRLTALAKRTRHSFEARWAGIALIAAESQHVIASSGGMLGIYRRSTSLSSYVVAFPDTVFVVLDAPKDDRFSSNPFVYDGLIRFYAGAAFRDRAGQILGALCITSDQPRDHFSDQEAALLMSLAAEVIG